MKILKLWLRKEKSVYLPGVEGMGRVSTDAGVFVRFVEAAVVVLMEQNPFHAAGEQFPVDKIVILPVLELRLAQDANHPGRGPETSR